MPKGCAPCLVSSVKLAKRRHASDGRMSKRTPAFLRIVSSVESGVLASAFRMFVCVTAALVVPPGAMPGFSVRFELPSPLQSER